jgi:hypothetical protein
MKLYVAQRDYAYEGFVILGIFENRDRAQEACDKDLNHAGQPRGDSHTIEEFTLNVKVE